ncbi:MAG: hypothetical protein A3I05_01180 [Deltaproteobacteria bacterium RIFCSPLOWO2_02_FULL_44_10]|nr:MAG: hypothetical protein A3C46_02435 [Deltaproteobacteria bacterium RIFCSPHIGHO2_02_FULL_44_16]OGQ47339.1 MAG: hypothetical protein A3I05_01180 [Deltaproteobacteria bacterium RIFCSPLOWO2_02_FULL_44_10]
MSFISAGENVGPCIKQTSLVVTPGNNSAAFILLQEQFEHCKKEEDGSCQIKNSSLFVTRDADWDGDIALTVFWDHEMGRNLLVRFQKIDRWGEGLGRSDLYRMHVYQDTNGEQVWVPVIMTNHLQESDFGFTPILLLRLSQLFPTSKLEIHEYCGGQLITTSKPNETGRFNVPHTFERPDQLKREIDPPAEAVPGFDQDYFRYKHLRHEEVPWRYRR